jgi:hypothetical protein
MREPGRVCVVAGVGPGNGAALTRRFAAGGYRVAMLARSAEKLEVIDAVIDLPWTRKRMPDAPDELFAKPAAIAETVWHLAHQDPSAWSFEVDLRPFGEKW